MVTISGAAQQSQHIQVLPDLANISIDISEICIICRNIMNIKLFEWIIESNGG